ncbi:MAG: HD domain-containing protein [Thermoplasmata archaeon]|nr:HD domain-containing protein [Thermoplasmata archaeon]MBE3137377.1 HD domain-containing protein [Thermoplasmata archaeon]MBE3140952.1 HD domain-containing protein [Thermoplasmata archaeon]
MIENHKIVRDPIHGDIKITGILVDLLKTPEVQRLHNIKQLGFAHLVFPGAHHTRFEHSLGSSMIASQIADILGLKEMEKELITCAAQLHDIGHGPFSHTLESILMERFGVDHVDLTEKLILGNYDILEVKEQQFISAPKVHEILDKYQVNEKDIVNIIRGKLSKRSYLSQLLNSTIDVDQLDYLMRDAYYTGVAYGMIDLQRLLQTIMIHKGNLTMMRKGVNVVENILMARALMYSSVYFHKTVRIPELMLSKALEEIPDAEPFEFFRMTDAEIMTSLKTMGRFQQEIITRLKYRDLFKQAYAVSLQDLDKQGIKAVKRLEDVSTRREKERELEDTFCIPKGHIIIDVPRPELLRAEPRINKTDIQVIDRNEIKTLDDFTPVAKAIRSRIAPDWAIMLITDEKYRKIVAKKSERILFS